MEAPTELQRQLLNLREHCEETRRCLHVHAKRHDRTATALEATMGLCGLGTAVLTFAGMNTAAAALAFATAASAAVNIGVLRSRDNEADAARLAGIWQRHEQDAARLLERAHEAEDDVSSEVDALRGRVRDSLDGTTMHLGADHPTPR